MNKLTSSVATLKLQTAFYRLRRSGFSSYISDEVNAEAHEKSSPSGSSMLFQADEHLLEQFTVRSLAR